MNDRDMYELRQFFGGYYNQDFDIEADTLDGVLDLYLSHSYQDGALRLADLIDECIESHPDDVALKRFLLKDLGSGVYDEAVGARGMLRHLSDYIRTNAGRLPIGPD